jgi:LacI family transcriptional regulator
MPSLTEVAKQADVSIATASMVLNSNNYQRRVSEPCAQRVREVAQRMGYVPNYHARSMKLGRAEVIAVAMDIGHTAGQTLRSDLSLPYFSTMLGAIELEARRTEFQVAIVGPSLRMRAPERGYLGVQQRRFDGLVILGIVLRPWLTSFMAEAPRAPVVVIEYPGTTELPVVDWDEPGGVRLALEHLRGLGHTRFLYVGEISESPAHASRRHEYIQQAARESGMRMRSIFYNRAEQDLAGRRQWATFGGEQAVLQDLNANRRDYTAILAYNDLVAIGVVSALARSGLRVPADVSVMGFDDLQAELCIPRLTAVSHVLDDMGRRAAELTFRMIQDPTAIQDLRGHRAILQPHLVVRDSTGPAAAL